MAEIANVITFPGRAQEGAPEVSWEKLQPMMRAALDACMVLLQHQGYKVACGQDKNGPADPHMILTWPGRRAADGVNFGLRFRFGNNTVKFEMLVSRRNGHINESAYVYEEYFDARLTQINQLLMMRAGMGVGMAHQMELGGPDRLIWRAAGRIFH